MTDRDDVGQLDELLDMIEGDDVWADGAGPTWPGTPDGPGVQDQQPEEPTGQ